jgi:hypothetical protein
MAKKSLTTSKAGSKTANNEPVEKIYCYKVFRRMDDGLLHSASVPTGSKLHKTYPEGKKTIVNSEMFNNGFGIMCFPDLIAIRNFEGMNKGTREIWKVEVGQIGELAARRPSISDLEELVPADKMAKSSYRVVLSKVVKGATKAEWPDNTVSCSWCIPIERVS